MIIRTTFMGIFFIMLLIGGTAFAWSSITTNNILIEKAYADLKGVAFATGTNIEDFLDEQKNEVLILSRDNLVKNLYSKQDFTEINDKLRNTITNNNDLGGEFRYILVLNEEGVVIAASKEEFIGKNKTDDPAFIKGKEKIYVNDIYVYEPGVKTKSFITVSAPVISENSKETLGVVMALVSLEKLNKITSNQEHFGGSVYIVNSNGFLITRSEFLRGEAKGMLIQNVDTENTRNCFDSKGEVRSKASFLDYRGEEVIGDYYYNPETEWCVLVEIDKSAILDYSLINVIKHNFNILIVSIFVFIFLLFIIGNSLEKVYKFKITNIENKKKLKTHKFNLFAVFLIALIFIALYLFFISSLFGFQIIPYLGGLVGDSLYFVISIMLFFFAFRLNKIKPRVYLLIGSGLFGLASLIRIPMFLYWVFIYNFNSFYWYPQIIMEAFSFFLILIAFNEVLKK